MDKHQMMLFHFTQQMTRDNATFIANYYKLPASTVDEIDRKNPGMVLVRALEQRLIICKDVNKLKDFHGVLKTMNFNDLAQILEDCYVELKEAQSPPPPSTSGNLSGETTDRGNAVMSDTQAQSPPPPSTSGNLSGETTDRGNAVMSDTQAQNSSAKPGETTASGNAVMEPSGN